MDEHQAQDGVTPVVTSTAASAGPDTEQFYQLQVDARSSLVGDSLFDIADKLLGGELDSARQSLERLWALRKEAQSPLSAQIIESLIKHYDSRVSALRARTERVKEVGDGARGLLDERRQAESRLGALKGEIEQCEERIRELTLERDRLAEEREVLAVRSERLTGVLSVHEAEVVGAVEEIVSTRLAAERRAAEAAVAAQTAAEPAQAEAETDVSAPVVADPSPAAGSSEPAESVESLALAKSVVKTNRGRVLGEYFYDSALPREARHYVYNTKFLLEQLEIGVDMLRKDYDQENHAELMQMVADPVGRVTKGPGLHYEIATSDLVNRESLQDVGERLHDQDYEAVEGFCHRLRDKLENLGPSYRRLLKAQMEKLSGRNLKG